VPAAQATPTAPQDDFFKLGARVEWRGKLGAPGRPPMFSLSVQLPGQAPEMRMLNIGETVYGDWKLAEYNPATQSVTLLNDRELVVLRSGQQVMLSLPPVKP
jgi:hypothetical protein